MGVKDTWLSKMWDSVLGRYQPERITVVAPHQDQGAGEKQLTRWPHKPKTPGATPGCTTRKVTQMIDRDIDYCEQQIEAQQEKISAMNSAVDSVMEDIKTVEADIKKLKEERARLCQMYSKLTHERKVEISRIGQMKDHRDNLKDLKKMMKAQNRIMEKKQ